MLYTGHGDDGYTHVIGGPSLPKCHARLEALGTLDEAQAQLGMARALLADTPWASLLLRIQADLRLLMAECAMTPHDDISGRYLTTEHLQRLENDLESWDEKTGGFRGFRTPGDSLPDAHLHLARTVIRRAERQVVALYHCGEITNPLSIRYMNRLSSWVYALAMMIDLSQQPAPANAA